jgi:hypothetical protein
MCQRRASHRQRGGGSRLGRFDLVNVGFGCRQAGVAGEVADVDGRPRGWFASRAASVAIAAENWARKSATVVIVAGEPVQTSLAPIKIVT